MQTEHANNQWPFIVHEFTLKILLMSKEKATDMFPLSVNVLYLFLTPSKEWKLSKIITQRVWMYAYLFYNYSTLPLLLELSVKCQCFLKLCCTICLFISARSITTNPLNFSVQSFIWAVRHFYFIIMYMGGHTFWCESYF